MGVEIFWFLELESSDEEVVYRTNDFLTQIYLNYDPMNEFTQIAQKIFLNRCFIELGRAYSVHNYKVEKRIIYLIFEFIYQSEKHGIGGKGSLISGIWGRNLGLAIQNTLRGEEETIIVDLNENCTLWGIKEVLARIIKVPIELIRIKIEKTNILDKYNGQTMSNLQITHNSELTCAKKLGIRHCVLVDIDKEQLTEHAKQVFLKIFADYSVHGGMNADQLIKYLTVVKGIIYIIYI